jgi:hypothetical protein
MGSKSVKHTIVDLNTEQVTVRDFTESEIEQYNLDSIRVKNDIVNTVNNGPTTEELLAIKNAKQEVLNKLGITEEQAKLLLS